MTARLMEHTDIHPLATINLNTELIRALLKIISKGSGHQDRSRGHIHARAVSMV